MAASSSPLNKLLYTHITKLKLLDTDSAEVRFRLKESPFTGEEDQEALAADKREEFFVIGQIFPKSEIYRERSYLIEMKLKRTFPADPPEVRFLTLIYHPNVRKDGKFCNELLQKTCKWKANTSLVEVLKAVVVHIDTPDVLHTAEFEIGQQYQEKPDEFKRDALQCVLKHGLPLAKDSS